MLSRRSLLAAASSLASIRLTSDVFAQGAPPIDSALPKGVAGVATLEALPGKKPLIKLSYRPPNYETPVSVFRETITPNDSFFVRWHLADIPEINVANWSLKIAGGANPLTFTMAS